MSASLFQMGWLGTTYFSSTIPSAIVAPLLFHSIYLFFKENFKYIFFEIFFITLIHPLIGIELSLIFGALFLKYFIDKYNYKINKYFYLVIIFINLVIIYFLYNFQVESDTLYIKIIANFRHPHHYIASSFPLEEYIKCILLFTFTLYFLKKNTGLTKKNKKIFYSLYILIIYSCIIGFIFTEIIPVKYVVISQPFRLLYILKWLSIIILINSIEIESKNIFVFLFSTMSLYVFLLICLTKKFLLKPHNNLYIFNLFFLTLLSILFKNNFENLFLVFSFLTILIMLKIVYVNKKLFLFLFTLAFIFNQHTDSIFKKVKINIIHNTNNPIVISQKVFNNLKLRYEDKFIFKNELNYEADGVVKYAKFNTNLNSVFLTPPNWGQFRLLSQRAIVVDYKCFPFREDKTFEWFNRMKLCYHASLNNPKFEDLITNYTLLNDDELLDIKSKLKINYAIFELSKITSFPVVFSNGYYKIVKI